MPCVCWFRHAGFIGGKPSSLRLLKKMLMFFTWIGSGLNTLKNLSFLR